MLAFCPARSSSAYSSGVSARTRSEEDRKSRAQSEESLLGRSDRIPSVLKDRIRHSHFEVSDVIRWLHKQDLSGVLTIWLLHLSAGNSRAEAWQRRFEREFPGITIRICEE